MIAVYSLCYFNNIDKMSKIMRKCWLEYFVIYFSVNLNVRLKNDLKSQNKILVTCINFYLCVAWKKIKKFYTSFGYSLIIKIKK